MPRFPFLMMIIVAIVAIVALPIVGTPVVSMLVDMTMGSWSGTAIEHDGTVTRITFDRNLPRPDWAAVPSGASIVQASHVVNAQQSRDVQMLSVSTRESLSAIRDFYRDRLSRAGFAVSDLGTAPMNARTAAFIGVADTLSATRANTGDQIAVIIHTPEGLFATTLVELRWLKVDVKGGKRAGG